ncbi:hypothetical protein WDW37_21115 [Bdellovibrionota bacterium FG-1]
MKSSKLGTHNGKDYQNRLRGTVQSSGTIYITPMTTPLANSFTSQQIIDLFAEKSLTLTEADLTANPMENIATLFATEVTDAALMRLRANVVLDCFFRVVQGLDGVGVNVTPANLIQNTERKALFLASIDPVNAILSASYIQSISAKMVGVPANFPKIGAEAFARTAIVLNDWLVPLIVANPSLNVPSLATNKIAGYGSYIGRAFYVSMNKATAGIDIPIGLGLLPNTKNCTTFTIVDASYTTTHSASDNVANITCVP